MSPSAPNNAAILKGCALFESLSDEDLDLLGRRAFQQEFKSGEKLFGFGDPGDSMMVILKGTIRLLRPVGSDKEMILADRQEGEIVGEMAVLDGKPRSAEARAVTNGKALVLARRDLLPFLEAHPKVCLSLLQVLCGKIRRADERTSEVLSSAQVRIAKTLGRLIENSPKLSFSQTELGDMAGLVRESVNRHLQVFVREGLIELRDGWIIVLDAKGLLARSEASRD